jgi:hypothetical protein
MTFAHRFISVWQFGTTNHHACRTAADGFQIQFGSFSPLLEGETAELETCKTDKLKLGARTMNWQEELSPMEQPGNKLIRYGRGTKPTNLRARV